MLDRKPRADVPSAGGDEAGQVSVCDHLGCGAGAAGRGAVRGSSGRTGECAAHRHLQSQAQGLRLQRTVLRVLGPQQT